MQDGAGDGDVAVGGGGERVGVVGLRRGVAGGALADDEGVAEGGAERLEGAPGEQVDEVGGFGGVGEGGGVGPGYAAAEDAAWGVFSEERWGCGNGGLLSTNVYSL